MDDLDRENEQFNKGVTHTVELLAKALGVTDWVAGDGSEDYDDDLTQTLLNVLAVGALWDKDENQPMTKTVLNEPDIRAGINILLEKIAEKFEGWQTWDIWRSDAALVVRGFKHPDAPPAVG